MNLKNVLFFVFIAVFYWLVRDAFIKMPLERDEGEYAYIAKVIEHGGVPYRDAFNQKPPAVFYTYLFIFKVFGEKPENIHLAVYFYNLISIFLLFKLTSLLYGKKTAFLAGFIYAFISSERRLLAQAANTEIFMLAPMIASWLFIVVDDMKNKPGFVFAAGIFSGLAVLFKQVAFTNFLGILIFLFYVAGIKKISIKSMLLKVLLLICGFLIPLSLVIIYFVKNNALNDLFYQVIKHNMEYSDILREIHSAKDILTHFFMTFRFLLESQLMWWITSFIAIYYTLISKRHQEKIFVIWFVMSFIGLSAGWRFTLHYFLQVVPAISVLSAAGIMSILSVISKIKQKTISIPAKAVFILLIAAIPLRANKHYYSLSPGQLTYMIYSDSPFREAVVISDYINKNSGKQDKIFILGSEPEIYFYSGRRSASRYIFTYPLTFPYSDVLEKQKYVIGEIKNEKPLFILYVRYANSLSFTEGTPGYLIENFNKILLSDYKLEGLVIGGFNPGYYWGAESVKYFQQAEGARNAVYIYKRTEE
ncbi:MAG: glycosyltransferase family 39 protein [Endomicrobiales bacterium]|nr:glycosyltransferase family 39 protein [Endomicrobiales bacterium]